MSRSRGATVIALASRGEKRDAARVGAVHALSYEGDWAAIARTLANGGSGR
ncbi:MAG: hypothetical protein ACR2M1_02665 [Gemmatimonadaceae bacterium]